MEIQQGYSYHIKDEFFDLVQDKYLMSNKEEGNYRPHYYAIQDRKNPKLYWMIPISSQAEKYKGIVEKKKKRYGKCNTIVIGLFAGKENAFLIQNTFPVIEKYFDHVHIANLLSVSEVAERYEEAVEIYEENVNLDDEKDVIAEGREWITVCNAYLEENDVNMDDVVLYDSMSQNNQKSKDVELSRLVRSTYLAENLKLAYNNCCQLCGTRLMKTRFDAYSEAHHIRPYNKTHKGDDTIGNMIVLCPNCHSQFDNLYYAIHPSTRLVHCLDVDDRFHLAKMEFIGEHELEEKYLTYTWKLFKKM